MKELPDKYIDLTVTSPPYGNLREYKGYVFDFELIANELFRITKDGGVVVWIVGDAVINGSETGTSFKQALYFKDLGFYLHDTMIYKKAGMSNPDTNRYYQIFEYMFVLSKNKPKTFNPIKDKKNIWGGQFSRSNNRQKDGSLVYKSRKKTKEYGIRFNIWEYNTGYGHSTKDDMAFKHPAIFPEKLAEDHVKSWSNEGDIVLDPMCGSGTTMKMAILLNRKFIGFDISQEYCELANKRLRPLREQGVLFGYYE